MATINQLISEIAHSVGQPNNEATRQSIRQAIIHSRNELIRKSYVNNRYVDKWLMQRFNIKLIDVPDGDMYGTEVLNLPAIKRTANKVPRPIRFSNGMPFQSIRTVGYNNRIIAYAKEGTANFYHHLAGFCNAPIYDYINEYIYIFTENAECIKNVNNIVIESAFEYPHLIKTELYDKAGGFTEEDIDDTEELDNNEFLLPEDMIGSIKELVIKQNYMNNTRETNEIQTDNLVK